VIHGRLSSRAGKSYSLARKIFSCERKVSSVIHTKYILYICATIEIKRKQREPIDRLAEVVRVPAVQRSSAVFRPILRTYRDRRFILPFLNFIWAVWFIWVVNSFDFISCILREIDFKWTNEIFDRVESDWQSSIVLRKIGRIRLQTAILERFRSNPQWDHVTNDKPWNAFRFSLSEDSRAYKKNCDWKRDWSAVRLEEGFERGRVACVDSLIWFSILFFFGLSTSRRSADSFLSPMIFFLLFCYAK